MINPEDDIYIELSSSCTVDEAVAKLIGWLQGNRRQKFIQLTKDGDIPVSQLATMHSLQGSLQEQLTELRDAASKAFRDAADGDALVPEIQEKETAVIEIDALIDKAAFFLREIECELGKGDASALKTCRRAMDSNVELRITLKSLDAWARSNGYSVQILEPLPPDLQAANDTNEPQDESDEDTDLPMGGTKSEASFLKTFAFLVEAFSLTAPKFHNADGSPNVSAIAGHLADFTKAYRYAPEPVPRGGAPAAGQGAESIKGRIEKALMTRGEKPGWPMKR